MDTWSSHGTVHLPFNGCTHAPESFGYWDNSFDKHSGRCFRLSPEIGKSGHEWQMEEKIQGKTGWSSLPYYLAVRNMPDNPTKHCGESWRVRQLWTHTGRTQRWKTKGWATGYNKVAYSLAKVFYCMVSSGCGECQTLTAELTELWFEMNRAGKTS